MNARRYSLAVRFLAIAPVALICAAAGACGVDGDGVPLPIFEGGVEGSTTANDGGADAISDASEDVTTTSDGSSDSSTNDAGDSGATATGLVISQVKSRGTAGGNDEFIEIYNASSASITFDSTWTVTVRNAAGGVGSCVAVTPLYTGAGQVIASHEHLLLATTTYSQAVAAAADATFSAGIPDAASVVLLQSGSPVDALCFEFDPTSTTTLATCGTPFVCEGTPSVNPHDNTTGTNTDASLERKPGGNGGNTVDVNDNATDFQSIAAADPHDLASAAVP